MQKLPEKALGIHMVKEPRGKVDRSRRQLPPHGVAVRQPLPHAVESGEVWGALGSADGLPAVHVHRDRAHPAHVPDKTKTMGGKNAGDYTFQNQ